MKNALVLTLLAVTVVFGGLYIHQSYKAREAKASAEGLRQQVGDLQSGLQERDNQAANLRDELEQTRADARTREAAQAKLQQSLTNAAGLALAGAADPTNSKSSNPLAELFKNPDMKEMIKNQQKSALGGMIDKNHGRLFSALRLTPEQSSTLKDLILNKQLSAADIEISTMFGNEADPSKRAEMAQQVKSASDAADAKIKDFLGDDNFAQYQTYEKTMGERMAVSGFKDQLSGGPTALTDEQEQQLIQAMTQERQNFKFTTDFSDKSKFAGDFASMLTEDKMNGYFQELGQLDQQYVARAQGILSPDQLTGFSKYLDNQAAMQKAGMQMAAKMFAPANGPGK